MEKHFQALIFSIATLMSGGLLGAYASTGDITDVVFDAVEKSVIEEYFKNHKTEASKKVKKNKKNKNKHAKDKSDELPSGLSKKETLPPGLAKQLERNGTLPPGLAKRDLPPDLKAVLPRPAPGYERILVGDDVLLIEKATGIIKDIIKDVLQN